MFTAATEGITQPLKRPSKFTPEFSALLKQILAVDPNERPTAKALLNSSWLDCAISSHAISEIAQICVKSFGFKKI